MAGDLLDKSFLGLIILAIGLHSCLLHEELRDNRLKVEGIERDVEKISGVVEDIQYDKIMGYIDTHGKLPPSYRKTLKELRRELDSYTNSISRKESQ